MKLFKSMMVGAAAVATAATAQAADLPLAPEPVDYVRICDAYGAFYYYIPGTDTCVRVGGRVRTQAVFNNMLGDNDAWGTRSGDGYTWRTDGRINLEAITATEFGDLRTVVGVIARLENSAETLELDDMYVQWGGLLGGRAQSQFDLFTGYSFIGSVERAFSDVATNQLAYTAAFGSGFSATVSVEDRTARESDSEIYGGTRMPDVVGVLGLTQGWGSAQIAGAMHQVYPDTSAAKDQLGWATTGAVSVNLPMLASGAEVTVFAGYTEGALSYINGGGEYTIGSSAGFTTVNFTDYSGADLSTGWNVGGGVFYPATETVSLALDGSYLSVDQAGSTQDLTRWAMDASVRWEPVQFLAIGADVGYGNTEVDGVGTQDELLFGVRMERTF